MCRTGCQADACCTTGGATAAVAQASAPGTTPMVLASSTSTYSPSRSIFRPARRVTTPTTREPALAAGGAAPGCDRCSTTAAGTTSPAAVMLRPVPVPQGMAMRPDGDASTWSPVQRVSGSDGAAVPAVATVTSTGDGSPVGRMPILTRYQPGVVPVPTPTASLLGPPPAGPSATATAARQEEKLPMPRPAGRDREKDAEKPNGKTNGKEDGKTNGRRDRDKDRDRDRGRRAGYPDQPPPAYHQPHEAPREFAMRALSAYVIEMPDILEISGTRDISDTNTPFRGTHLVRPDGTIGFGTYPPIFVAGMTIEQAKRAVAEMIATRLTKLKVNEIMLELRVDVANYNSKFIYVMTDGGGYGEQVFRLPYTGNEKVLDAIAQIQGLPSVASKAKIWVARATPNDHVHPHILPVDYPGITKRGSAATNYQLYPGDRIYVDSDPLIRTDSRLAKILAPIERLFGVVLLGSSTVNSIRNSGSGGGGNNSGSFR